MEQAKESYQDHKEIIDTYQEDFYSRKKNLKQQKEIKRQSLSYKKFNFPITVSFN